MNYITFENKKYILGDIVIKDAPIYSKGCRSVRDLIKKKDCPRLLSFEIPSRTEFRPQPFIMQ
jgi:hypothetical protein